MRRLAHIVVALAIALAAIAVPCQALLAPASVSPHRCCGSQPGTPAGSQQCQTQCASSSHPSIVPDAAPSLAAIGPIFYLEQLARATAAFAPELPATGFSNVRTPLYLQHSSLLI